VQVGKMRTRQIFGLMIFAFGAIILPSLYTNDIGTHIHLQTYVHGPLNGSFLEFMSIYEFIFIIACIPLGLTLFFVGANKQDLKGFIKPFAGILLLAVVVSSIAYVIPVSVNDGILWSEIQPPNERLVIPIAYTNGTANAVFLDVRSEPTQNGSTTEFDSALIRDVNGTLVYTDSLDETLAQGQSATIRVDYNFTLSSVYWITLKTKAGGSFYSPTFAVGDNHQDPIFVKEIIYDQNQSVTLVKCTRIEKGTSVSVGFTNGYGGAVLVNYEPVRTQLEDGTELAIYYALSSGKYNLYLFAMNQKDTIIPFTVP
jgi:hypothetical protein